MGIAANALLFGEIKVAKEGNPEHDSPSHSNWIEVVMLPQTFLMLPKHGSTPRTRPRLKTNDSGKSSPCKEVAKERRLDLIALVVHPEEGFPGSSSIHPAANGDRAQSREPCELLGPDDSSLDNARTSASWR
jgi:hypothetical protein